MYKLTDLSKEIAKFTDDAIKNGNVLLHPKWVTAQILLKHSNITGDDSDFYACLAEHTVYDQVKRRIAQFKLSPEKELNKDAQIILPGFERLQIAYVTEVNGEQVAIPLKRMFSAQRHAKIAELVAMGKGCYEHADELRRYDKDNPNPNPQERLVA